VLKIGSRDSVEVRSVHLNWGIGLRLLYASDLHLTRWTPHIVEQLHEVCQHQKPDGLLLGGDLVDLNNGLSLLAQFIQQQTCPVWAVGGNHDELVGIDYVRACVEFARGCWLEQSIQLTNTLSISGVCGESSTRYSVLCAHDPAVFPHAVACGYDLVLAGHLHGGQCVLGHYKGRMYPAGLFFRWNGDSFTEKNTTMLVSKGLNDTLPIRWNCPREVILCSF
jgi:predicted MPP superfamily phosphohydrolase